MAHSLFSINMNQYSNDLHPAKITVVGTAVDIKHHAAVLTDDSLLYYLDGIDHWDAKYMGKRVKVTGKLVERKEYPPIVKSPNPEITAYPQPRLSDGKLIKKAKWKLVK